MSSFCQQNQFYLMVVMISFSITVLHHLLLLDGFTDLLVAGAKNILVFDQPPVQKYLYTRLYNNEALFTQLIYKANSS